MPEVQSQAAGLVLVVRGGAHRFLEMNEQAAHFGDYRRSQEFAGENAPTFTRAESRFIVNQRVDQFIQQFAWAGCLVAANYQLLDLCGGDPGAMAMHTGFTATIGNLIQTFVAPIMAGLSDTYGRVPVQTLARIGRLAGVILMPYCTTLNRRKIFEIFLGMTKPDGGLVMAGSEAVFDAARSDLFATRPGLAAQIDAKNGLWGAFAHTAALSAGAACTSLFGGLHGQWMLARVAAVVNIIFTFSLKETLAKHDRKPFTLASANPFSNTMLLFRNGPGLRKLAISQMCETTAWVAFESCAKVYRFGPLGWSPENEVVYKQVVQSTSIINRQFFLVPFMKKVPLSLYLPVCAGAAACPFFLPDRGRAPRCSTGGEQDGLRIRQHFQLPLHVRLEPVMALGDQAHEDHRVCHPSPG